jgi:hypothetical protein
MTLLTVVQDVCATVGVMMPTSVFSNIVGNRTMQEMLALANETVQRISYDTRDWVKLRKTVSLAGTDNGDGTSSVPLPADCKRLLLTSNIWRNSSPLTPLRFIPDLDEWMSRRAPRNYIDPRGEWIRIGDTIAVAPTLVPTDQVRFAYMGKNCVALTSGGFGDRFMNDGDSFIIDERLMKLGMTWQWKAQKGSPYAEDLGSYGDALALVMAHDAPAPIIIGRQPISAANRVSYPFATPVEPVIPI